MKAGSVTLMLALVLVVSTSKGAPPSSGAKPVAKPATAGPKPRSVNDTLTGQPKADYESARVLVADGDYAGARVKFQAAYDGSKDPRLLWNLAACDKQMRHYSSAIATVKKFAADSGPLVSAKDREEAAELIKTLEPFTVAVTLDVTEPDATVEVDDAVVGTTPLAGPVVVDIGQRKFRVRKEGYLEFSTTLSVGGSATQVVPVKLEKEVHEGKLSMLVPAGAKALVDGKVVLPAPGTDALEITLPAGGHTLRVTAPGMRAYEREIVVKDKETRAVEVALEREAEPDKPKLRVAVGCGEVRPRGADEGLTVFLDDSPAALVASGGKQTWDEQAKRNVVDYVEFPVSAGPQDVRVRIAGCVSLAHRVDVDAKTGADLSGTLDLDASPLWRGPAWDPVGFRLALGVWFPSAPGKGTRGSSRNNPVSAAGGQYRSPYAPVYGSAPFDYTGVFVSGGWTSRFFVAHLDVGAAWGTATRLNDPDPSFAGTVPDRAPTTGWYEIVSRFGVRAPLNVVALSLGPAIGLHAPMSHADVVDAPLGMLGGWFGIDIQPLCDFLVFSDATVSGDFKDKFPEVGGNDYNLNFRVGLAWQPNSVCRRERAAKVGLVDGGRR